MPKKGYRVTENELLSIVKTLKWFINICLGIILRICTDNKNLPCLLFNANKLLRWILILEDYGPGI